MIDKRYLAGFIDGEGYISLLKHKDIRVRKGYTLFPTLKLSNTDKEAMEKIGKFLGGNVLVNSPKTSKNKAVYRIQVHSIKKIRDILKSVQPYLIIKNKQADLMIKFCEKRLKTKVREYSEEDYQIAKSFSELNKRG